LSDQALRQLCVFLEGRLSGFLERDTNGRLSFRYEKNYPSDATPLSPSLPIAGARFTHEDVAPFVTGLLPDDDRVVERWARMFGIRAGNVFALLAQVGLDCAGAVQFVPEERLGELDQGTLDFLSDADVELMLRNLRTNPHAWQQPSGARAGHFSLAGAQIKFALHRTSQGWARSLGRIPTTHIFKPAMIGITDHDLNEHLCLRAASHLGLAAARSEIATFGSERTLIVERYDRRHLRHGVERVHQVDMCQARGVSPQYKYERDGGPGAVDLVQTLRMSLAAESDVHRFVRGLIFNWVIGGTDAHAKNYGLLLSGTSVRLTPLYDLASATMFEDWNPHKWELAMRIGGEARFKYLTARHWKRFAHSAGVPYELILNTAQDYATRISEALAEASHDLPSDAQPYAHQMIERVTSHCTQVLGRL
jgi:serine/threonine-protein kinase HipA